MRYYIITYGCQMNKSDSERIAAQLEKRGHQPVQKLEQADLVIINVCSVRQSAVDRVYAKIKQIRNTKYQIQDTKYRIILTGCLLQKDRARFALTKQGGQGKKILKNQVNEIWPIIDLNRPAKCQSKEQAFVPIMTGCNHFCSYCVVPYTRGREYSRSAEEIIQEVKELVKKGYKEIILLGQNVNSYQPKLKSQKSKVKTTGQNLKLINFPKLLKLINDLPGNFQIRFLTSHPKDMSDELIETIAQYKKVAKEIHLPVQSGDNEILKKMNRGYTVEEYKKLIKKIRQKIPGVKISTDVIVGFPGETKKQFQKTIKLFQWAKFNQAYIARYSPRPGTAASKLKDNVPSDEKKRRRRILEEILHNSRARL